MKAQKDAALSALAKELVFACREHAVANEWSEIIHKTQDRVLQSVQPQLIMQRLHAALILGDDGLIEAMTERLREPDVSVGVKLSAVKELSVYKRAPEAAAILINDPVVRTAPRFPNAARHVFLTLKDESLRKQLKRALSVFRGGGDLIKPTESSFLFAPQPENEAWGTVTLATAPGTAPHHAHVLSGDAASFRKSAAAGRQPDVQEFRNVFTEPSGQVWTEKGELIISRAAPISTTDRSAVETIPIGFSANRGSRGIYHWLIDYLPRFGWIRDSGVLEDKDFRILLNGSNPGFEQGTLDIVGLGGSIRKLTGPVFVERLLLGRVTFRGMVGWRHLDSVFGTLGDEASRLAAENGVTLPERVYITRRDADRRVLLNEAEIETLARDRGFEVQEFSSIPLWHQIALARKASVIMAPHGAGLSHIVFSPQGTKIVELLPIKDGSYALRFNYARLSIIKGHDYRAWLEEQRPRVNSWAIDIPTFEPFLDSVLRMA